MSNVKFSADGRVAHLTNGLVSYVIEKTAGGHLTHRYFGRAVRSWNGTGVPHYVKHGYDVPLDVGELHASADDYPFELPVRGSGDFRSPALVIERTDGLEYCRLRVCSWEATKGKQGMKGLPSARGRSDDATLVVTMADDTCGLRVRLHLSVLDSLPVITRHMELSCVGDSPLMLCDAMGASLELPTRDYDAITLYGGHAKEGNIDRHPLHYGIQRVESARGTTSPQAQPFMALVSPGTNETIGEVYAVALVYSGNFLVQAERDEYGMVRLQAGINPSGFSWLLEPGETFVTPEALLVHSSTGLDAMSQAFHRVVRERLMPKRYANLERPILLNSWESMYYDVSEEKVAKQARMAKHVGIELWVLDDGWFRSDNSSLSSMGDWKVNRQKLPHGIEGVARIIHDEGMRFGLWFEPEAVSPTAGILSRHPDWTLMVPGYAPTLARHEQLLDLGNPEVRAYLLDILGSYLDGGFVDYVKWDMNRPLTDIYSSILKPERAKEAAHRYVLGLYELLREFGTRWPRVILEGCSSGGARLDFGLLACVAQNWTSDNTDACDRVQIQRGLSLLYPPLMLGAHVSAVPNHQTGRVSSLSCRYEVARQFCLGYELDLCLCSNDELLTIATQIRERARERAWLGGADFHRLDAPDDNHVAWMSVSAEKDDAMVFLFQHMFNPLKSHGALRIPHLDRDANWSDIATGFVYGGDELEDIGLVPPVEREDFYATTIHLVRV